MSTSVKARFLLIGTLLFILFGLAVAELYAFPQSIDEIQGASSVHFATSRSWRLLADSCISVNWETSQINAVFLNGEGRIGAGEELLCGENQAVLRVDFSDGHTKEYTFSAVPFFATGAGWFVLLLLSLLSYSLFYKLRLMPSPRRFLNDTGDLLEETRGALSNYFAHEERSHIAIFIAIMLCGLVLRLLYLDTPIRYDEASSLRDYVLVDNIFDSLSRYDRPNNHLFNTLLMYLSVKSFGTIDEWVLRLPQFFAGILSIFLTYIATRQTLNKNTALLAAAFVAVSPLMIVYSVMARGYILQIACFMGLLILSNTLAKKPSSAAWLLFAICTALGFYAVITMLYGFVGLALYLLLRMRERRQRFWEWCVGIFWAGWLSLLLYMPVLSRLGFRAITGNSYTESLEWGEFVLQIPAVVNNLANSWLCGNSLLLLLLIAIVFPYTRRAKSQNFMPLPFALLSTVTIIMIQQPSLYAAARIFLFLQPLIAIAIAETVVWLLQKVKAVRVGIIALTMLLALIIVFSRAPYLSYESGIYHDAEAVTAYLVEVENPNFRLAFSPIYNENLNYYFMTYEIPLEQISRDYGSVDSIYFIVRDNFDLSVDAVRRELIGRESSQFTEPELVASFEFSDLYRMDRRKD